MKRALALVLALVLVLGLATVSFAEEKVQLTALFIAHPLTKSVEEMKWLKEIADDAGVEITWEQIYTDWDQLKTTRFASGDIPDIRQSRICLIKFRHGYSFCLPVFPGPLSKIL